MPVSKTRRKRNLKPETKIDGESAPSPVSGESNEGFFKFNLMAPLQSGIPIPDDILFCILEHLDKYTVIRLRSVSRIFLKVATIRRDSEVKILLGPPKKFMKQRSKLQQLG